MCFDLWDFRTNDKLASSVDSVIDASILWLDSSTLLLTSTVDPLINLIIESPIPDVFTSWPPTSAPSDGDVEAKAPVGRCSMTAVVHPPGVFAVIFLRCFDLCWRLLAFLNVLRLRLLFPSYNLLVLSKKATKISHVKKNISTVIRLIVPLTKSTAFSIFVPYVLPCFSCFSSFEKSIAFNLSKTESPGFGRVRRHHLPMNLPVQVHHSLLYCT